MAALLLDILRPSWAAFLGTSGIWKYLAVVARGSGDKREEDAAAWGRSEESSSRLDLPVRI